MVAIPQYQARVGLDAPAAANVNVDNSVGQALGQVGAALSHAGEEFAAHQSRLNSYNDNLQIERWRNDQEMARVTEIDQGAVDGSDLVDRRSKALEESFAKVKVSLKDPTMQRKADEVFEAVRGNHIFSTMQEARKRGDVYVETTTRDSINNAVNQNLISSEDEFQAYYQTQVKPRIDRTIADPLKREQMYAAFGQQLRQEYARKNPGRLVANGAARVPVVVASQAGRVSKGSIEGVNPDLITRFRTVQDAFGQSVPVVSGARSAATNAKAGGAKGSQHLHGNALDLDVSNLPFQERRRLIELASANGITGIGVYNNSLHFDLGGRRSWGPDHHRGSVPKWAASSIMRHETGTARVAAGMGKGDGSFAQRVGDASLPEEQPIPAPPEGGIWEGMPPDEWQGYVSAARQVDAQRIKAEVEAKRQADDEIVKSGYDLVAEGALSPAWIEQNRDALSPTEYRVFKNATRRQNVDQKTDNEAYVGFISRATADQDQGAVQDEAFQAFSDGKLAKTDFNRIVTASRRTLEQQSDKPWLTDIRKTVSAQLAPSDPDDKGQYAKRLDGLFELDDWVAANPKATRDEVRKKANELVDSHSKSAVKDLRAALDMPKYSTVARYAMSRDSVTLSAQKLVQAYKGGRINSDELNRETALLKRWASVFDEEARLGNAGP